MLVSLTSDFVCITLYVIYVTILEICMATLSIRMDDKTKNSFENFCDSVGLTVSAAVNLFAQKVVSTHEIPFKICEPDPFWSEENQAFLKKAVTDIKNGVNVSEHELIEVD